METVSAASQDCNPRFSKHGEPVRPELVTWELLVVREPRLLDLYHEVSSIKDEGGEYFCANRVWDEYHPDWDKKLDGCNSSFKGRLFRLVGFASGHPDPLVRGWKAHRVAHSKIYGALPDCRNCGCIAWHDYIEEVLASRGQTIPRPFSSASPQVAPGTWINSQHQDQPPWA